MSVWHTPYDTGVAHPPPSDARAVTAALGGRWQGRYGLCGCPAHDDRTPSLSVSDGRDGRLLLHCHAGCDYRGVRDALAAMGIVAGGRAGYVPDPQTAARQAAEEARERAKRMSQARTAWAECLPAAGTLVEPYLRVRAILAAPPSTLRFHPRRGTRRRRSGCRRWSRR